jgi:hypothetical protein
MAEPTKSLYERTVEFAHEIGLEDGDERFEKYVDQVMTQAGWRRRATYEPPQSDSGSSGKKDGGWF